MSIGIENINILLHGLFFMTLNPATRNLEIHAPSIPDHHFVGGTRGSRKELNGKIDLTKIGLEGQDTLSTPPSINDVPGSIFQFVCSETKAGYMSNDPSKYK